ncbi:sulfotransferase domain-containing protein [Gammaproteobacteria bacterium]|nr:sulfotransferase domain-containing protein [Gammaproteobacteria bacterium]
MTMIDKLKKGKHYLQVCKHDYVARRAKKKNDANLSKCFRDYLNNNLSHDYNRILLSCFAKSGSTYLSEIFSSMKNYERSSLTNFHDRREQELDPYSLLYSHANMKNYVSQLHVRYHLATKNYINFFNLKPIVLVRNIFDVVISFKEHLLNESVKVPQAYVPDDYIGWDEIKQLDFIVEMIVPWYFNFFVSWKDSHKENKAIFITYEELNKDVFSVVKKINDYHNLDLSDVEINNAIIKANENKASIRKNVAVIGRGEILSQDLKNKIIAYSKFYNTDFGLMGL